MSDPDLYNEKRYKIRVHVILHNNEVYLHRKTFATVSSEKFSVGGFKDSLSGIKDIDLQKMNVLRRIIAPMGTMDAIEFINSKLKDTKNNAEFFNSMNKPA